MVDAQAETLRRKILEGYNKAQLAEIEELCQEHVTDENTDSAVVALLGLGHIAFCRGEFEQAERYVLQAASLAREKASPASLCEALCQQAHLLWAIAKLDSPGLLKLAQEALNLAQQADYQRGIVSAKITLGAALLSAHSRNQAQIQLDEALTLARTVESDLEQQALNALAQFYNAAKKPGIAIEYGNRALKIARACGAAMDESILLSNMSTYYVRLTHDFRSNDSAIECGQKGLALARRMAYRYGELIALAALGNAYRIARRPQDSVHAYQEALVLARSWGHKKWEYQLLFYLANLFVGMGFNDKAYDCLVELFAFPAEIGLPVMNARTHILIGNIFRRRGRTEEALKEWREGLKLERKIGRGGLALMRLRLGIYTYALSFELNKRFGHKPELSE